MSIRPVKRIIQSQPTIEGAGVRLRRAFGFGATDEFDPFLLLDDFRNENPEDYLAGFPWHPHRGIDRKSTRLNSSHPSISYAVFCLKKKNITSSKIPIATLKVVVIGPQS